MKNLFTIGEFSKISNLSIDTLRFYDKIGLLSPEFKDPNSKYRYYGINQLVKSDIIKLNRDIGMSIEDIKQLFLEKEAEKLKSMLTNQKNNLKKEIEKLNLSVEKLENLEKALSVQKDIPAEGEIYTKIIDARTIMFANNFADNKNKFAYHINIHKKLVEEIQKQNGKVKYGGGVLSFFENNGDMQSTSFEVVEGVEKTEGFEVLILPKGEYLCINFHENSSESAYSKFTQELKKMNINTKYFFNTYMLMGDFEYKDRKYELQCFIK